MSNRRFIQYIVAAISLMVLMAIVCLMDNVKAPWLFSTFDEKRAANHGFRNG